MFDDPQPDDEVKGKNGYCSAREFRAMTELEKCIFAYGEEVEGKDGTKINTKDFCEMPYEERCVFLFGREF